MDLLENTIQWVRDSYFFTENDSEITTYIRLYQSKYDWIGTKQTLVCNKIWLAKMIHDLSQVEIYINCHNAHDIHSKLKGAISFLNKITLYKFFANSSQLDYIFSGDLYVYQDHANNNSGFLSDIIDYVAQLKSHSNLLNLKEVINEIYTIENINKIYETKIIFGYAPNIISTKPNIAVINNKLMKFNKLIS